jgi:hypothetical protein
VENREKGAYAGFVDEGLYELILVKKYNLMLLYTGELQRKL